MPPRRCRGRSCSRRLASNLQQHGFVENFLGVVYYVAAGLARFDTTSHMLSILLVGAKNGLCGAYATTPVAGCSAHFGSAPAYTPASAPSSLTADASRRRVRARREQRCATDPRAGRLRPAGAPAQPSSAAAAPPSSAAPQPAPSGSSAAVQQTAHTLQNLVNYLLK